ncbi:hypothetical protein M595_1748 [Lyngbya aestuarii BL J]|uniref:Uncharacterized protein n=1 Tax=Lyngbya aestuarii BL J TaxID=1348334 RepID=U7QPB9_9CYAN|nr:hypothetical protein M595_1748 [Lyngbya aestuarii BL J]
MIANYIFMHYKQPILSINIHPEQSNLTQFIAVNHSLKCL